MSVTVAMRTVGLLLVSALMVVPVATAQQLTRSFRSTLAAAMALGVLASVGGLVLSAYLSFHADVAPGPDDRAAGARRLRRHLAGRRMAAAPAPAHGAVPRTGAGGRDRAQGHRGAPARARPDCGHLAVPHGDHVDYVHDGHRHAAHGGHYDEH